MKEELNKYTLVIGASVKPVRYSYIATNMLREYKHDVYAFGLRVGKINEVEIKTEWPKDELFDTITLYLNAKRQVQHYEQILDLKPKRVIFNPGTENEAFYALLSKHSIPYIEACTLVMLRTNQF